MKASRRCTELVSEERAVGDVLRDRWVEVGAGQLVDGWTRFDGDEGVGAWATCRSRQSS